MKKQCKICGKEFSKKNNVSLKTWENVTKYCSRNCQEVGVGKEAGLRLIKLNKSRVGIPIDKEVQRKKTRIRQRNWYLKNKERISDESRVKYLNEDLDKKERRKILREAQDKIPGVREKRLAYHINYSKLHSEINYTRSQSVPNKYKSYISSAKKRNHDFTLTFEKFKEIFHSPCKYCGKEDARGIDRVDNKIGYTTENSAPCCEMCNRMKWKWTEEEFKLHITKIYKNFA